MQHQFPKNNWFLVITAIICSAIPFCMVAFQAGGSGCFFVLLAMAIIFFLQKKNWPYLVACYKDYPWFFTGLILWFLLIISQMITMQLWSGRTIEVALRFLSGIIIFPFIACHPSSFLRRIEWGIIAGAIAACIYAIISVSVYFEERASNFFINSIMFGNISLLLGFWSLASLYWDLDNNEFKENLKIVAFFAGFYASILSGARGGWIAIPLLIFITINLFKDRNFLNKRYMKVFFAGCVVLGIVSSSVIFSRVGQVVNDINFYKEGVVETSTGHRMQLWKGAITIFKEHPIFGAGKREFRQEIKNLANKGLIASEVTTYYHAHNEVLFMMAEFGVAGLVVLLIFCFGFFIYFYKYRKDKDIFIKAAAHMGLMLSGSCIIFGFTEVVFDRLREIGFFVLMPCLFLGIIASRQRELRCQAKYYIY